MIDPSDQNHQTNVFRVKESSHPLLQKRALFALGKRRDAPDGAVYTIYLVKEIDKGAYKVDTRVGAYSVPKTFDEKYGDLTVKEVDTEAFADIGDAAIQAAETVEVADKKGDSKGSTPPNLDVVQIPGRGDCFFQSVAYCILADDKFLAEVDFEPWISEDDLKATAQERKQKNLLTTSDAWIARMRERVSDGATVAMYLHGHEMALQSLDRKLYVKLMHAAESPQKKSDATAGDVYKEGSKWYYVHGPGKASEQLDSRPYPPIWNESQSEKKWISEQAEDIKLKSKDPDGAGEITAQKQFLERCTSFKRFKAFIKTAEYWADERAVDVLSDRLQINILILDVGYGANSVTGVHADRSKTIILQRTGQHYNAMFKTGTSKYVFDTAGKIVSKLNVDLKKKKGGGNEEVDEELEEENANAVKSGGAGEGEIKNKDPESEENEGAKPEENEGAKPETTEGAEPETTEGAVTEQETTEGVEPETNEGVKPETNEGAVTEPKTTEGGSVKRSKKNRSKSSSTRKKKIVIHTDVPF
jgi:hypothetical protein